MENQRKTKTEGAGGRKPLFSKPEELWALFVEYKEKTKKTALKQHKIHGAHSNDVYEKHELPLTQEGFCLFLMDHPSLPRKTTSARNLANYFEHAKSDYKFPEFFDVTERITMELMHHNNVRHITGIYRNNPTMVNRFNPYGAAGPYARENQTAESSAAPVLKAGKELPKD